MHLFSSVDASVVQASCHCFDQLLALVEESPQDDTATLLLATLASIADDSPSLEPCEAIMQLHGIQRLLKLLQLPLADRPSSGATIHSSLLECLEVIVRVHPASCRLLIESPLLLVASRLLLSPEVPFQLVERCVALVHRTTAVKGCSYEYGLDWVCCVLQFGLRVAQSRVISCNADECALHLLSSTCQLLSTNSIARRAFWVGRCDRLLYRLLIDGWWTVRSVALQATELVVGNSVAVRAPSTNRLIATAVFELIGALVCKQAQTPLLCREGAAHSRLRTALVEAKVLGAQSDSKMQALFVQQMSQKLVNSSIHAVLLLANQLPDLSEQTQAGE